MALNLISSLCEAAARCDLAAVEAALAAGAPIHRKNLEGDTPLHIAVRANCTVIVSRLLEAAADVSATDMRGNAALHLAAERGYTDIVALLLQRRDINVNMINLNGFTALNRAILRGHVAVVHQLLPAGANVNLRDAQSRTPLHNASELGMIDIVDALLRCDDIEVDARDDNDRTPLYMAAMRGHTSVVSRLLEIGADINAASRDKITPLIAALNFNRVDVARLLLQTPSIDVRAETNTRCTALHAAALYGHLDIVHQLLDAGADVHVRHHTYGLVPLNHATRWGCKDVVELLLLYGADPNAVNSTGNTALQELFMPQAHVEWPSPAAAIARLLLEHGADVNASYARNSAGLSQAARKNDVSTIIVLLAGGAKLHEDRIG